MPIGTYFDTMEDLGQDYREPPVDYRAPAVQPPAVPAPALPAPAVAPPGAAAVTPPGYTSPFLSDAEAEQQAAMRRLQYSVADLPLDEAEKAVTTALKFQAIRGYQKDLAGGMSAVDALTRWAPIMFSQPKAGNLGQAASLVRAGRTDTEKYMDVGGVGYMFKGGKATALTPPKVVPPKTIALQMPADPENPMSGGHVTIPLQQDDPLVKAALERARKGPTPPPPEPPGLFTKAAWPRLFGVQPPAAAPAAAPVVAPPVSPVRAAEPVVAPTPAALRPTTPQAKLDAARALRKQHPDWTKKQILDAVNQ